MCDDKDPAGSKGAAISWIQTHPGWADFGPYDGIHREAEYGPGEEVLAREDDVAQVAAHRYHIAIPLELSGKVRVEFHPNLISVSVEPVGGYPAQQRQSGPPDSWS